MLKIAAIIGGVLLMAGVALAGTLTSLDSTNSPAIGTTTLPALSTERQEDHAQENVLEQRGRANEPNEDVSGPCDEPEHAGDPRCTGTQAAGTDDNAEDNNSGPSDDSGHDGGRDDNSGPGGGHDD
jgi:hypothetical protein